MSRGVPALQPSRWVAPALVIVLLVGLHLAGSQAVHWLRYDRAAVLAGEWWRLGTGHLVHGDLPHLGWNLAGLLLVWWLFGRQYTCLQWIVVLLGSTAAIGIGFLWLEPELIWYVGFSGLLHGCVAAGLVAWIRREPDGLTLLVGGLFAAKLAWEYLVGPLPFSGGSMSLPVIHEAHAYGALGGLLCGLAITSRRSRRPRSL